MSNVISFPCGDTQKEIQENSKDSEALELLKGFLLCAENYPEVFGKIILIINDKEMTRNPKIWTRGLSIQETVDIMDSARLSLLIKTLT